MSGAAILDEKRRGTCYPNGLLESCSKDVASRLVDAVFQEIAEF
jgi:hypothetical protein